jgi:ligand-binding sensor domain-containing protein
MDAQNVFPVKVGNCDTERFCLDCGDIKAGFEETEFRGVESRLNESLNLNGVTGSVHFQVLVGSNGKGCVLSHTDQTGSPISKKITKELNRFKKWTPATTEGVAEKLTSINLEFVIGNGKLSGQVKRVDMKAFKKSFDQPKSPEIFNEDYTYANQNLSNYKITVWNTGNSDLPNNMNDHIAIEQDGRIWLTLDEGLVTFDGANFHNAEQDITEKGKYFTYRDMAIDNDGTLWCMATGGIYSHFNGVWTKYEESEIGIDGGYSVVNNPQTEELFFCSDEGITVLKDGQWTLMNLDIVPELSSKRVAYAKRDSKGRLWIGTYGGSLMIDSNGSVTDYEKTSKVLKGKCITSMDEDGEGNVYFSLYELDRKDKKKVNNNEGIAIGYQDGSFKQFTTDNSGMPFNHANCVRFDKAEKVLWISTDRAGLVRYDLNDGWENYHNENSDIPTSYISTMIMDNEGVLYLATRQGLVKVERK